MWGNLVKLLVKEKSSERFFLNFITSFFPKHSCHPVPAVLIAGDSSASAVLMAGDSSASRTRTSCASVGMTAQVTKMGGRGCLKSQNDYPQSDLFNAVRHSSSVENGYYPD
jgi:hypothetical protein